jgi:hypothetical protein
VLQRQWEKNVGVAERVVIEEISRAGLKIGNVERPALERNGQAKLALLVAFAAQGKETAAFFFFSYEAFRNRAGANGFSQTIPTPEMYTGDFSNWVDRSNKQLPVFDPTSQVRNADGSYTRTQFPNNKIPSSLFDPISVKALAAYTANGVLKPNTGAAPGTVGYILNNYFVSSGSNVSPNTKISIKGDGDVKVKGGIEDQLSFRLRRGHKFWRHTVNAAGSTLVYEMYEVR